MEQILIKHGFWHESNHFSIPCIYIIDSYKRSSKRAPDSLTRSSKRRYKMLTKAPGVYLPLRQSGSSNYDSSNPVLLVIE